MMIPESRFLGRQDLFSFLPSVPAFGLELLVFSLFLLCTHCSPVFSQEDTHSVPPEKSLPKEIRLKPVKSYPHSTDSFCQGLLFGTESDGTPCFYESAGRYGRSAVKKVLLESGETLKKNRLKKHFFGEGAALFGDRIYQITWQEETCFVYDKETLRPIGQFKYKGEGWGLTSNETDLIMSDGSDRIVFRDPQDFRSLREIHVFWIHPKTGEKKSLPLLNELEWIEGEIWANIFETAKIARINPQTGEVIQILDFTRYIPKGYAEDPERVLNGIAWDKENRRLFITGKEWPVLYELSVENPSDRKPL